MVYKVDNMKEKKLITAVLLPIIPAFLLLGGCSTGKTRPVTTVKAPSSKEAPQARVTPPNVKPAGSPSEKVQAALPAIGKEDINGDPSGQTDKDSSPLLEQALSCVQDSVTSMDKDDAEDALAKLDEAYSLLLDIECTPDSPLSQEKSALRILIAQRINQIYASRQAPLPTANNSIPLVENMWVEKEIKSFQTGERKAFIEAYKRSGLYRELITEELKKAGLPEELFYVPMIESWFRPRALSTARALGMWQFIRSTGYRYGLKQDKYIDERMDPAKSTQAAIKYLTELHRLFGDWTTALAAYNCGEMNVLRVIRAQKVDYLDNFWDLFNNLPYETARYVPRFIATLLIVKDPAKYGFELPQPDPALAYETVEMTSPVKLTSIAQKLDLDQVLLVALNPELRHNSTPNSAYSLRVPVGYAERCKTELASLPTYVPPDVVFQGWYTVRSGDTLGAIAKRYRTTPGAIARLNKLKSVTMIHPGQKLRLPGVPSNDNEGTPARASAAGKAPVQAGDQSKAQVQPQPAAPAAAGEATTYTVARGDTLFEIAKKFNTTVDRIKDQNSLKSERLSIGQKLTIPAGS